ncbi:phosphate acetyltransferase [Rhodoblastus sphagnicola]|uniref:Phosphate acetyltransferase n=1 Tax=Rhodoblastus sphagnicola TaxID=333368 RepID=A0A2S6NG28_9HYPH|nr:phosphate acetyltransferase [Rhodoblastus sphagnicola]MBB4199463.1 phosphate acetyltransferase [Rhodoblastus sphagnicola]PPQ33566.1 phosphate acetyltransferase [Rhodoblastus sphagnicola]
MNAPSKSRYLYLVPVSREAGLTSMALGLVRALQLSGVRVGFVKPIAQPEAAGESDLACHFARALCGVATPDPISFDHAAYMVRSGRLASLMEEIVAGIDDLGRDCALTIVEGLIPDADIQIAIRLNIEIIRSLGADLVPVLAGGSSTLEDLAKKTEAAIEQYGDDGRRSIAGVLINHCHTGAAALQAAGGFMRSSGCGAVPILAAVPDLTEISMPRVIDIATGLGLEIVQRGDIETLRVKTHLIAARAPEKLLSYLRPGTLVVTPADRADAILAAALLAQRGMPLAGFVLTCGGRPAPEVLDVMAGPPLDRLPILGTEEDTFTIASRLSHLSSHIAADDPQRMERVIAAVAEAIDTQPLQARIAAPVDLLMPPPVFRHRLVEAAREIDARIVLPEGDEPRTLKAAVICAERKIARCVLLGSPAKIRSVAAAHGLDLPPALEIVDPDAVLRDYVAPMVELRKSKGLTPLQAEKALEDTVVLGTMMLARDVVDGLVSGAVHTTANTVRPAMQLIKTAPGSSLISSIFFMLMPDQVFVYGDCAINPAPNAEELAEIAIQSADSATAFGIDPRIAMISYSTGVSGAGENVEKVRRATGLVRARRPDLVIDGPIQYDAASVESVGLQKAPSSPLHGHANVFIFPDLNTGNTTYKAVQRAANVVTVGPMLQGLRKPVNDLSRGALVDDIVYTIALTAIQAGARKRAAAAPEARAQAC